MEDVRASRIALPTREMAKADVLTDDFAPVEFLDSVKTNNTSTR